ncbi:cytochrome b [Inmirania thermothiophila]|uniref:Cytochrome b561 n=1 Tax=Inmirania thermothiophila TaxID=1750597 RepID=A0A3N1Y0L9_9GAMM|nr:cytochrome b [Inmirania thermothiophila]ROR32383.1 cytochrome b561 [Inmirania thermothiophila]
MQIRNTRQCFGWVAITLHWVTAAAVLALFPLGVWMVDLDYYHPWYNRAPALHVSVGMTLLALILVRIGWRLANPVPAFEPGMPAWERLAARAAHYAMYALLLVVTLSGYLIPTADGKAVAVFGLVEVPALPWRPARQEDLAGLVHRWAAWTLMGVATLHTLAALKHHFLDRDRTLVRMLRPGPADANRPTDDREEQA